MIHCKLMCFVSIVCSCKSDKRVQTTHYCYEMFIFLCHAVENSCIKTVQEELHYIVVNIMLYLLTIVDIIFAS